MICYADTSLLVAALTNEARTVEAQDWLNKQKHGTLALSEWVVTEFSAALSIKLRTGQMKPGHRADVLAMFTRLVSESFLALPISPTHFRAAARFADQYGLSLRAGDALHLAVAADHGAMLCTLDQKMAEAGPVIGVRTLLL